MAADDHLRRSAAIPCLRYRDAPRAIDWLCRNFGFEKHRVVPDGDGGVAHAELALEGGMIMIGSVTEPSDDYARQIRQPDEVGGFETQSVYLAVPDPDAAYRRALTDGAIVVIDIRDEPYGGRDFTCRDPEGHLWTVGSYDPWRHGR